MTTDPVDSSPPPPPPPPAHIDPGAAVKIPAMCLMIIGAIGMIGTLLGIALVLTGVSISSLGAGQHAVAVGRGPVGVIVRIAFLILQGVITLAGLKMGKLQAYNLALAGSVLAIIPCVSPCFLVGIPFGIWALVVLLKPEVKAAFDQRPGFPIGH